MQIIHKTESGYTAKTKKGGKLFINFNNFSLQFSMRSLVRLRDGLRQINLAEGMFTPEKKCYEVFFSAHKLRLTFDYFEIHEFIELVEETLSELALQDMLHGLGVSMATDGEEDLI